jgi:MFS family permease
MLIPGGMLVDTYGPRRCVLIGITGLAALLALYAAFVSSFVEVIVAHIAMATVSSVSGVPVYSLFIAQWFQEGIGLAMGLTLAGFSLGGTVMPAVLGPIATEYGWRAAVGVMSSFLWLVGLPVAYMFLDEKRDESLYFEEVSGDAEAGVEKGEAQPLLSPSSDDVAPMLHSAPREKVDNKSWTFVGFALSYMLLQYSTLLGRGPSSQACFV